ncbi:MAG: GNAT family N-acetyltransferase [Cyanobacteria bacterium J06635_15]
MKFLLDTNIIIPIEPVAIDGFEANTEVIASLIKSFQDGGHQYYVHRASINELKQDLNVKRRDARIKLLGKYPVLKISMDIESSVSAAYEGTETNSHNTIDQILLSALVFESVDYLVTDDLGIHKKAAKLGFSSRVATSEDTLAVIQALFPEVTREIPPLNSILAYELDEKDPIFQSFRTDYPMFDSWLAKCKREHRQAWTINLENKQLQGICIVKIEEFCDYNIVLPTLKICSFKVSEEGRGFRYGELFLKGIFDYADRNNLQSIYVETFEKQTALISLFLNFGFQILERCSQKGELILSKTLVFSSEFVQSMEPLEFNIRFGPRLVKTDGVGVFVIPIIPKYHRMLFPEFEEQLELFPGKYSFGNGIRKAYLCHANVRAIKPGDLIIFYRSQDVQGITSYGVVEELNISCIPDKIARAVGKRTVYTFDEIQAMCSSDVLAISFRLSSVLENPVGIRDLISNGVVTAAPQSIVSVRQEGSQWIKQRLAI